MLGAVDQQIAELVATRDRMQQTLRVWDRKLATTGNEQPAYSKRSTRSIDPETDSRRRVKNRR
jgi:hypothetical protein